MPTTDDNDVNRMVLALADRYLPKPLPHNADRVERIRQQIAAGGYVTPHNFDVAADRLIDRVLQDARDERVVELCRAHSPRREPPTKDEAELLRVAYPERWDGQS